MKITMTHNWNTMLRTPKATNDFGSPLLDDYGQDDLCPALADANGTHDVTTEHLMTEQVTALLSDGEPYASTHTPTRAPRILAVLSDDMPAMVTSVDNVEALDPDFIDDGMAWWIGRDAAVACPADMASSHLLNRVQQGGWLARTGAYPAMHGIVVMPHGDVDAQEAPVSRNKEQYLLWQMVQETLLPNG